MEETCQTTGFLESSATFLGTMVTLLVLCVFYESTTGKRGGNNFLFRIIQEEKQRLKEKMEELRSRLDLRRSVIMNSDQFQTVERYADGDNGNTAMQGRALAIKSRIAAKNQTLIANFVGYYRLMDKVDLSNQQFTAPLYSLVFGLFLFIIDECVVMSNSTLPFALWVLFFSLALSIVYWILMWVEFWIGPYEEKSSYIECTPRVKYFKERRLIFMVPFETITGLVVFLLALKFVNWTSHSSQANILILLFWCVFALSMFGFARTIVSTVRGRQSYSHILGHAVAVIVFAVLCSALLFMEFGDNIEDYFALPASVAGLPFLRFISLFFVFFNGLIFPFVLPFIRYRIIFSSACGDVHRAMGMADKLEQEFQNDYSAFCADVTKANAPTINEP